MFLFVLHPCNRSLRCTLPLSLSPSLALPLRLLSSPTPPPSPHPPLCAELAARARASMYVFIDVTRDGRTQLTARKQRMHREYTSVFRACLWHPLGAASAARDFFITLILERCGSGRGRKRFNFRTALHSYYCIFLFRLNLSRPHSSPPIDIDSLPRLRTNLVRIQLGRVLLFFLFSLTINPLATINFNFKFEEAQSILRLPSLFLR